MWDNDDLCGLSSVPLSRPSRMFHIDFSIGFSDLGKCNLCERKVDFHFGPLCTPDKHFSISPASANGLRGVVAVCNACHQHFESRGFRKTRLLKLCEVISEQKITCISVLPGLPIHVIVRGYCDDQHLAAITAETFRQFPQVAQDRIVEYVSKHQDSDVGFGIRIEALPRWKGRGRGWEGQNSNDGHAIRIRSNYMSQLLRYNRVDYLRQLIAHEFAHTEQCADGVEFATTTECERDAEARQASWGFPFAKW